MPRAYSLDLRERLIDTVETVSSARAAARWLQVSASTAVKGVQRKHETGSGGRTGFTLRQIGARLAAEDVHVSKS